MNGRSRRPAPAGHNRDVDDTTPCPCRRGDIFGACCGPLLAGRPAPTAEALMRSRFTAFAVGDTGYLLRTWHADTRPAELELDPARRWLFVEIARTAGGGPFDESGTVEFTAHYRDPGGRGRLHETSRFRRVDGRWQYVDGEVDRW
ncbi:YchJ family protein [Nocardia testacea]|uniref:YchJ family protein n=1 Tax=Nocardia testacea TaxID=248551 RepID=UPI003A863097